MEVLLSLAKQPGFFRAQLRTGKLASAVLALMLVAPTAAFCGSSTGKGDQNQAYQRRMSGDVRALEAVMWQAQSLGRVLDARLIGNSYRLKILSPSGHVRTIFYDAAASTAHAGSNAGGGQVKNRSGDSNSNGRGSGGGKGGSDSRSGDGGSDSSSGDGGSGSSSGNGGSGSNSGNGGSDSGSGNGGSDSGSGKGGSDSGSGKGGGGSGGSGGDQD